jgi:Holliday junction resolvase RusA-like endonuclease
MKLQKVPQKIFTVPVAIHLSYNSRLDLDNHGYLAKMIVDALKGYLIEDDDRKHVQALIQDFHGGKDIKVEVWEVGA